MIVVTGGNGFIGANLVNKLRDQGEEVYVVDEVGDVWTDPESFLNILAADNEYSQNIKLIYHQGACSDTTCYDPFYMMNNNFSYSAMLLNFCMQKKIRLVYASSAAVYGNGPFYEKHSPAPKNIYAKSKALFDDYVKCFLGERKMPQVVGLRYFNVYGPLEHNKGKMASVIFQFFNQIKADKKIKIFKNSEKYTRDFISVEDVVNVNLHFMENPHISGIYNCGTGKTRSFYDIATIMQNFYDFEIEEIEMPDALKQRYQRFTQSDNTKLVSDAAYINSFLSLEEGIERYLEFLKNAEFLESR
ncbi:MAG: putative epimerase [Prokaryotic dsDNA virus sp.]|nr:MAG: putative epimerase [Prokaryotic dsDNA virus sp.]|tara:strand:- start:7078 stop:7983 length:906 start_codon:yes stop_codon:yes gene_type:complete